MLQAWADWLDLHCAWTILRKWLRLTPKKGCPGS